MIKEYTGFHRTIKTVNLSKYGLRVLFYILLLIVLGSLISYTDGGFISTGGVITFILVTVGLSANLFWMSINDKVSLTMLYPLRGRKKNIYYLIYVLVNTVIGLIVFSLLILFFTFIIWLIDPSSITNGDGDEIIYNLATFYGPMAKISLVSLSFYVIRFKETIKYFLNSLIGALIIFIINSLVISLQTNKLIIRGSIINNYLSSDKKLPLIIGIVLQLIFSVLLLTGFIFSEERKR